MTSSRARLPMLGGLISLVVMAAVATGAQASPTTPQYLGSNGPPSLPVVGGICASQAYASSPSPAPSARKAAPITIPTIPGLSCVVDPCAYSPLQAAATPSVDTPLLSIARRRGCDGPFGGIVGVRQKY